MFVEKERLPLCEITQVKVSVSILVWKMANFLVEIAKICNVVLNSIGGLPNYQRYKPICYWFYNIRSLGDKGRGLRSYFVSTLPNSVTEAGATWLSAQSLFPTQRRDVTFCFNCSHAIAPTENGVTARCARRTLPGRAGSRTVPKPLCAANTSPLCYSERAGLPTFVYVPRCSMLG